MPPGGTSVDEVIARLHALTGAESARPLPTLTLFKIGVTLDMAGYRNASHCYERPTYEDWLYRVLDDSHTSYRRS